MHDDFKLVIWSLGLYRHKDSPQSSTSKPQNKLCITLDVREFSGYVQSVALGDYVPSDLPIRNMGRYFAEFNLPVEFDNWERIPKILTVDYSRSSDQKPWQSMEEIEPVLSLKFDLNDYKDSNAIRKFIEEYG